MAVAELAQGGVHYRESGTGTPVVFRHGRRGAARPGA
jgi:hypothetical protein